MLFKNLLMVVLILNILKSETKIDINWIEINQKKQASIKLFTGENNKVKKTEELNFIINFEENINLSSNKQKEKWGINCIENYSCIIKDKNITKENFYSFQKASIFLRFSQEDNLIKNQNQLDFRLAFDFKNYQFDKNGLISFSPSSDFLIFLINNYGLKNLVLNYEKNNLFNLLMNYEEKNSFIKSEHISRNEDLWMVKSKLQNIKETNFEDCHLDFLGDYLIAYNGGVEFCKKQINNVCNKKDNCSENDAKIEKAANIEFFIDEHKYVFFPKDYIRFENNQIFCLISDKIKFEYSIGIHFFKLYNPVLNFEDDNLKIQFIDYFHIELVNKLWLIVIFVLLF